MYFLLLGLTVQDAAFGRLGLKVLSKVIEREKILPDGARGRKHLICRQTEGAPGQTTELTGPDRRTEVTDRTSPKGGRVGGGSSVPRLLQKGAALWLLVASFSGSCPFPVIQIVPVRTLSLRLRLRISWTFFLSIGLHS